MSKLFLSFCMTVSISILSLVTTPHLNSHSGAFTRPSPRPQSFEVPLKQLRYVRSIWSVGSGGVHIFKDSSNKQYVFKHDRGGKYRPKIQAEIMADDLYRSLKCHVPKSRVYRSLPRRFYKNLTGNKQCGFIKATPYIETKALNSAEQYKILKPYIQQRFVLYLLAMRSDLTFKNFIIDQDDKVWQIDNGQFFPNPLLPHNITYNIHKPNIAKEIIAYRKHHHCAQWLDGLSRVEIRWLCCK